MRKITVKFFTAITFWLIIFNQINLAETKLPKLISDGMVLQRDIPVKIWGWASPGEEVKLSFQGEEYSCTTNDEGKWLIVLPEMEAGGPFDMEIIGTNKIVVKNIMIGEVWICSGQSNMQTPMSRLKDLYADEIKSSENNYIRYFTVPQQYDFNKQLEDLTGGKWETPNPNSVLSFAAIPYFFGRNIYEKYNVPVGIINSSVGGTPIEAWMSEDALKEFPAPMETLNKYKDSNYINSIVASDKKRNDDWYTELMNKDLGYKDEISWHSPEFNTSDWSKMTIPAFWEEAGLKNINGSMWFRKEFDVPNSMTGKPARLNLGTIVDSDSAFVNGKFVGTTSYQYPPRVYQIPAGILKEGKNIITVRIVNNIGRGGFIKEKPYNIVVDDQSIDLKGEWSYKVGAVMKPLFGPTFIHYGPTGLFNGMIAHV
jgi:sialate O-acetylesterase